MNAPLRPGRAWQIAVGLFALAAALRILAWERSAVIFSDGPRFLRQSEAVLAGDWGRVFADPYHPLFAILAAGVQALGLEPESAAAAVSIAAGSLAVVCLFFFLREAFGAPYDAVGALLFAAHSRAIEFSSGVQSEGLYLLLFVAALWFSWRALERGTGADAFGAGCAAALAFWVRPEGLGVACVAAALTPFWAWWKSWTPGRWARVCAALALGAALGVVPFAATQRVLTGAWALTQKPAAHRTLGAVAPSLGADAVAPVQEAGPAPRPTAPPPAPAIRVLNPRGARGLEPALEDLASTARSAARPTLLVGLALVPLALRRRPGRRAFFSGRSRWPSSACWRCSPSTRGT